MRMVRGMKQSLNIDGWHFELTVRQQRDGIWHWLVASPGKLVLSGEAPSEADAVQSAYEAGHALARLAA
jgi:hypothetical protein